MASGGSALILQILAIFLGGGSVQLVLAIYRSRRELKEVDARTESITADISDKLNERLSEQLAREGAKVDSLEEKFRIAKEAHESEMAGRLFQLETEQASVARLSAEVVRLRVDLTIANRQIAELMTRLPAPPITPS